MNVPSVETDGNEEITNGTHYRFPSVETDGNELPTNPTLPSTSVDGDGD